MELPKEHLKIALFDHVRKFSDDIVNHWKADGHEVRIDRYLDPEMVHWCDVAFFEFCDISIQRASDMHDSFWTDENPQPLDKKIVVRVHDIDAWTGNHNGVVWDWVDDVIFVAKHIQQKVLSEVKMTNGKTNIHLIKHGVNPDKYTFRDRSPGKKIAWVGNINEAKNLPLALQVLIQNPDYELHVVGSQLDKWKKAYVLDFVNRNQLKFFHYERVDDEDGTINGFLEDKDYILLTSMKEAFSFVVAEAMLKGIRPLIHWFYGAENVWPEKYLWNRTSEVMGMLHGDYSPKEYREFIKVNYNFQEMLDNYDKIIYNK